MTDTRPGGSPPSPTPSLLGERAGVERVLDLVPTAIWRCDAAEPLRLTLPADQMLEALQQRGTVGYANVAHAELHGFSRPAELIGLVRSSIAPAISHQDLVHFRRFVQEGFRLTGVTLRTADREGRTRFYRASWLGVVEREHLVAMWTILDDITAERELEQRVAVDVTRGDDPIVGQGAGITRVREKIEQVADTDATVLIRGETGTGKELIARAIHQRSRRRTKPLVAVNCGAISPGLVESELFGHEKGAFTGAVARKIGHFELADGGTLFLDEIGDLSPELQVKLLRVLQEGELQRVGGSQAIRVDVRVIAATHRDLPAMVQAGSFRQDLYYRLNVFPLTLPPLRERREDIPLLVQHFVRVYAGRLGRRIETIPPGVLASFEAYGWPGNIRELANLVERSAIVSTGPVLQLAEWATGQHAPVGAAAAAAAAGAPAAPNALLEVEREHITRTLEQTGWKVSGPGGAAEALGLKPTTLEARMRKLGITRPGR